MVPRKKGATTTKGNKRQQKLENLHQSKNRRMDVLIF